MNGSIDSDSDRNGNSTQKKIKVVSLEGDNEREAGAVLPKKRKAASLEEETELTTEKFLNSGEIVKLNVGGKRFETYRRTLCAIKGSFFDRSFSERHRSTHGEHFIDMDPKFFEKHALPMLRSAAGGLEHRLPTGDDGEEVFAKRELVRLGLLERAEVDRNWSDVEILRSSTEHYDTVGSIAILNGKAYSAGLACEAKAWDLSTGKCELTLQHEAKVKCVAIVGDKLCTGDSDGKLSTWNLPDGSPRNTVLMTPTRFLDAGARIPSVRCLASLHDDVLIAGSSAGRIHFWRPSDDKNYGVDECIRTIEIEDALGARALLASKGMVIVGVDDGWIFVYDAFETEHQKTRRAIKGHAARVNCLAAHGKGAISGAADKHIKVWDENFECLVVISASGSVGSLAVWNDDLVYFSDGELKVHNLAKKRVEKTFDARGGSTVALTGDRMLIGYKGGMIEFWGMKN